MVLSNRFSMIFFTLILVAVFLMETRSQPEPQEMKNSMQKLEFLVGHWKGEGWKLNRDGTKQHFRQTEDVQWKLDGAVLLVEGIGRSAGNDNSGEIVHQALGVISYDQSGGYQFNAFLANGRSSHSQATLMEKGKFIWTISPPHGGTIRYTLKIINGTWHEIGEYSRNGNNWSQFLEMNLKKR